MDEQLKEAFAKVKQDIFSLGEEISHVKLELSEIKIELSLISSFIEDVKVKSLEKQQESKNPEIQNLSSGIRELFSQTNSIKQEITKLQNQLPTHTQEIPTQPSIPTHIPTLPSEIKGLLEANKYVSIGNKGVPTDKPTNQQTNQHIIQHINIDDKKSINHLEKASELLANLDSFKKEVRLKFKRLTQQEMQVFSLLYSLEDTGEIVDYKTLASRLGLSESSIRDYISKIQKKGIPINKEKLNNKQVILHISQDLRKIASLNTIRKLREL